MHLDRFLQTVKNAGLTLNYNTHVGMLWLLEHAIHQSALLRRDRLRPQYFAKGRGGHALHSPNNLTAKKRQKIGKCVF